MIKDYIMWVHITSISIHFFEFALLISYCYPHSAVALKGHRHILKGGGVKGGLAIILSILESFPNASRVTWTRVTFTAKAPLGDEMTPSALLVACRGEEINRSSDARPRAHTSEVRGKIISNALQVYNIPNRTTGVLFCCSFVVQTQFWGEGEGEQF